jgi:hypothetical protein
LISSLEADLFDLVNMMTTSKLFNRTIRRLPINFLGQKYPEKMGLHIMRTFVNLRAIALDESVNMADKELFSKFSQLQRIHVDVSGESFIGLQNLINLRVNSVENLDKNINLLPNKHKLKMLAIDCLNRRDDELYDGEHLANIIPKLECLHVRYRDFTDQFFHNFSGLKELCLVWCYEITDEAFRDLPNLERLYMRNTSIGDGAFKYIPKLCLLHFESCFSLTNNAFKYLPELESLTISYISPEQEISDEAFTYLSNLKELSLQGSSSSLTLGIFKYLPNLKRLDLSGSELIGPELFKVLYQKLDWLDIRQYPNKPFKMTRNIFSKLYVKELYIDESYIQLTRSDLKCLVNNGLEYLSFVINSYFSESRFSPVVYTKKTFYARDVRKYLAWTTEFIKRNKGSIII